jgi:hypothetical protein
VCFFVPRLSNGNAWRRVVDTAEWAEPCDNCWPLDVAESIVDPYWVHAHSLVVLVQT